MPARSTRARAARSTRPISIIPNIGEAAASYVALTRHREKAELFVARQTAADLNELARQMARRDERRAASQFFHGGEPAGPVRPLTPVELLARLAGRSHERRHRQDRIRSAFVQAAQEELERRKPTDQGRSAIKEKEKRGKAAAAIYRRRRTAEAAPIGG